MRRNGVPPLSARHLQEAIIGSTLMYGSEVTWRGQGSMRDDVQRAISLMSRSSMDVFGSTPVGFLEAAGGSMPAEPRLDMRQAVYANRVMSSELPDTRRVASGNTSLERRLREASRPEEGGQSSFEVERESAPRGLRFPGSIVIPGIVTGEEEKKQRNEAAIEAAQPFRTDPRAFWTDGSAVPGGTGAGAIVGFVEGYEDSDKEGNRFVKRRGGIATRGRRSKGKGSRRTYGEDFRSFRRFGSERGMRTEAWCLRGNATAFDAELSAVARGVELCLMPRSQLQHLHGLAGRNGAIKNRHIRTRTEDGHKRDPTREGGS